MRKFDEICKEVGYDRYDQYGRHIACPFQDPAPTYNAYKNGQCFNFENREDAKKFSKLVETVTLKNPDREKWFADRRALEGKASEIFHKELRDYHKEVNDKVYNICYAEAHGRGHHAGYDEVANYLEDIIDFALRIIKESQT